MRYLIAGATICALLVIVFSGPVLAGEPTGVIGPMNPTMFRCVQKDGLEVFQPDPFRKETATRFNPGGAIFDDPETIQKFINDVADIRTKSCTVDIDYDFYFGEDRTNIFDTTDAEQFNFYLDEIEDECDEISDGLGSIVPIRDTRIDGRVYEFHPRDYGNPAESEWFGVPSRSVPVRLEGITFEIFWASDDNGFYYFDNLGAGPIVANLQLPPDANPINPDVVIFSDGSETVWTVFLGFYRGEIGPPNPVELQTPEGNFLPFVTLAGLEDLSRCGFETLPDSASDPRVEVLPPPINVAAVDSAGIPNVGGVLPHEISPFTLILAAVVLIVLPAAGVWGVRRYRAR